MKNHPPTLKQLAAAAGVSVITASRALNGQPGVSQAVRNSIQKLAAESGFTSRRTASQQATLREHSPQFLDPQGEASPTLAALAAATGVSAMTVSRALNNRQGVSNKTREAILKQAAEMGYVTNRVAQKLSSGQSGVIGVLATHLDSPFISSLVNEVVRAATAVGNEVLIYTLVDHDTRPAGSVLQLLQQFTDGVVVLLPYGLGYAEALTQGKFPLISIDSPREHSELPSIAADSYGGARSAMKHLAELGHKRIAFVTGAEQLESAQERRRAYEDAVAVFGLERDQALVLTGDYSLAGGRAAGEQLLKMARRPTAVFVANDLSAFGLMAVLQEGGVKIPADMSVVGFDDLPGASQIHPGLTTVRQPMAELGRAAVSTLQAIAAGLRPATAHLTLPTELVVRGSTSAPRSLHGRQRTSRVVVRKTGVTVAP
jgi:LacI family transcriptional regulator